MKRAFILGLVILVGQVGTATAFQIVQEGPFGPTTAAFQTIETFDQFNGDISDLNWVKVEIFITDDDSTVVGTNNGQQQAAGDYAFGLEATASSPVYSPNIVAKADTVGSYDLAPTESFNDASDALEHSNSLVLTTVAEKTPFVGTGTFDITIDVKGFYTLYGTLIDVALTPGTAAGKAVVTYDYVPEPSSLILLAFGGLAATRRRRR